MEASSGHLFERLLKQSLVPGQPSVSYKNQIAEFLAANANKSELINEKSGVVYSEPTTFASYALISQTPDSTRGRSRRASRV
ncbi:hypothetical protein [Tropicimonas marinistellae]|uniref:hypothetical protein n=1 Tax=Tropicimonas marinistellae TaxID=1739787 RepID=UPI00082EEBB4|nr:hypothetical protein [Tropicimonas marinistellae]